MIKVKFFTKHSKLCGFEVSGHSDLSDAGRDILCAAVSSAAYMTANTLEEVLKLNINAEVNDGYMKIEVTELTDEAENILKGFRLHISALAKDYRNNLKVIYGGAQNA